MRTFIAVELPAAVRARAVELIERLERAGATVKWVDRTHMHLTLKFLGDVDDRKVPGVCTAVAAAVAPLAPFSIECGGAGAFPSSARPRTVWLGVAGGEEPLLRVHAAVDAALAKQRFRRDSRRFHPHLTIGRVRRGGRELAELGKLIGENADFHAARAAVSEVVVFSSQLAPGGPVYHVLGRARLSG